MAKIIDFEKAAQELAEKKRANKPYEFAWSWEPDKFYPISKVDLARVFELLEMSGSNNNHTANIRFREQHRKPV